MLTFIDIEPDAAIPADDELQRLQDAVDGANEWARLHPAHSIINVESFYRNDPKTRAPVFWKVRVWYSAAGR
jgi:hypothetical protein